jgi:glycosyltransferase involved in cell wall biosynthesis
MQPRISFICTAYNAAEFISQTIESVLDQTMDELEFIVVDDGSTDGTADIVEAVRDPRLLLIRAPHSGIPAVGRNIAIRHSQASIIAVTDADDVSLPTRLQQQLEFLERHPQAGLVHTLSYDLVDGESTLAERQCPVEGVMPPEVAIAAILHRNFIRTSSVAIRRKAFEDAGGFDEDVRLCGVEDFALWLQCYEQHASIGYINEPLIKYRIHPGSLSSDTVANSTNTLWAMEKAVRRSPARYESLRKLVRQRQSKVYVKRGISRIRSGRPGARRDFWSGLQKNPISLLAWKWLAIGMLGDRMAAPLLAWRERKELPSSPHIFKRQGDLSVSRK